MLTLQLPPIGNPESNLMPGMASPLPPEPAPAPLIAPILQTYTGGNPNIPDSSVPGPLAQLQEIVGWVYDFDPATGVARASFSGEVTFTSGGSAGAVTSFNTRTGAVVLTAADVTGVGGALAANVLPLTGGTIGGNLTVNGTFLGTGPVDTNGASGGFNAIDRTNGSNAWGIYSNNNYLNFSYNAGASAMFLENTGLLVVPGTVLVGNGAQLTGGTLNLQVQGSATQAQFSSSAGASVVNIRTDVANSLLYFLFGASTNVGTISTNGSATAYNTSSDRNLKENIADIDGNFVSEIIDYLSPVSFTWKAQPDLGRQYGFVAQDVNDIFPNAVTPGVGLPGEDNFRPWQIDTLSLIPLLLAEIQSLRQRVAVLESGGVS